MTRPDQSRSSRVARAAAVVGAAALTLGLPACGGGSDPAASPTGSPTDATTAAPSATPTADAPARDTITTEDGSISLVLPTGYTLEPTAQTDIEGNPLPAGTEHLLQAASPEDDVQVYLYRTDLQDLDADSAAFAEGFREMGDAAAEQDEGSQTEVSEPVDLDVDGEPAKLTRAVVSYLDPISQEPVRGVIELLLVNHDGAGYYLGVQDSPGSEASPARDIASSWRWNLRARSSRHPGRKPTSRNVDAGPARRSARIDTRKATP